MPEGPFVQIATFCQGVTRRPPGNNMTIEGCVTVVNAVQPTDGPIRGDERSVSISQLTLALSIWSWDVNGPYRLAVRMEPPAGEPIEIYKQDVLFVAGTDADGIAQGIDLQITVDQPLTAPGTYWFPVLLSSESQPERRIASVPLTLSYTVGQSR